MALVHSPETVQRIKADRETHQKLSATVSTDIVWQFAVRPIQDRIKDYPDAERLYNVAVQEFSSPKYIYRPALSFGDFHPGSMLMEEPKPGSSLTPVLVDWEFGRANGRGVNSDIAQFLSSLRCEILDAANDARLHSLLLLFVKSFCSAYRDSARLHVKRNPQDSNLQHLRSAFCLHGREVINQAHDIYHASPQFKEMTDMGVWYLARTGDSADHFVSDANWEELKREDHGLIQSLFIFD